MISGLADGAFHGEAFNEKRGRGEVRYRDSLGEELHAGNVVFVESRAEASHVDFVTRAWVKNPVELVLSKMRGYVRP